MKSDFFNEKTEASEIKGLIVKDYFSAWAKIMNKKSRTDRLAYIDLFAGPGRYKDGTKSTPIKVMETILSNPEFCNKFVTIFNDENPVFATNLEKELLSIPGIENLKYKPQFICSSVCDELAEKFERRNMIPSLAFIDPWGYKGLTLRLIDALIKDWGSDCIFFFNYNRINMGIPNPLVIEHLNSLFGENRANELRKKIDGMSPVLREQTILNDLAEALTNGKINYVLPFRFMKPNRRATSHYLILVSKHILGYTLMKKIMYRYSSEHNDGVASFSYIPVVDRQLSILSLFDRPLDSLGEELLDKYKGKTLTVKEIFDSHQVGTPFVMQNYKEALRRLEAEQKISCNPSNRRIYNGVKTMADNTLITFPN